jgi:hypothetical protein
MERFCNLLLFVSSVVATTLRAEVIIALYEVSGNEGGLNGSMQHWLGVYLPEFQSPKFSLVVG